MGTVIDLNSCLLQDAIRYDLRRASLSCLHGADYTIRDNPTWLEYNPQCFTVDGFTFLAAEPLNTISSLDFDEHACIADKWPNVADASLQLGFGSFAMHATGNMGFTGSADVLGIQCVGSTLLDEVMRILSTSPEITIADGVSFNISHAAHLCRHEPESVLRGCDLNTITSSYRRMQAAVPPFEVTFGHLFVGVYRECFGDAGLAILANHASQSVGVKITDFISFRFATFPPSQVKQEVCGLINQVLIKFLEAVSVQGNLPGSNEPELHHLWHTRISGVIGLAVDLLNKISESM
eukprot:CAMPEP_0119304446 /NCGR_PEP_ID=MMETSP1333-20130426/5668_1 /TAXON_ID=418940 /ORGANISM="Scyphosphaera apsteinii, Strain RCC1455" /LENGTH=293 /DNA_ID=CAMNT_0007307339 /DNA_START=105 /DNA_END=986 /DNA_ORIENTATION=-